MKTVKTKKGTITYYETKNELPAIRWKQFNKMCLIQSNVGNDMESIVKTIQQIDMWIAKDEKKHALSKRNNLFILLALIHQGVNPGSLAFAPLVYSINGKEKEDLSEEGFIKTSEEVEKLNFTVSQIEEMREDVKKNFMKI